MQIDQILLRPKENLFLIQYSDNVGKSNNIVSDTAGNAHVATLITEAQSKLPAETDRPDKGEIEQEIEELECRLKQLKQSIGVA